MLLALALLHFQLEGRTAHIRPHPELRRFATPTVGKFALPHLQYFGGHILANVKIVGVYWNDSANWFGGSGGQSFVSQTDHFYQALVVSSMFTWLAEYSTPSQTLGTGSYLGGTVIAPANTSQTLSEPEVQAELVAQIAAGHLPQADADTLYQIHFAPGITLRDGTDVSCQTYCAYHDSFQSGGKSLFFSVIPDHQPPSACSSCGESTDWYKNMTASASHEAIEAVTDPEVGLPNTPCGPAWCDPADPDYASEHAEIGDICEVDWSTGNGATSHTLTEWTIPDSPNPPWTVQREWSNAYGGCLTTAPEAFKLTLSPSTVHADIAGTYDVAMSTTPSSSATLGLFKVPAGVSATFSPGTLHLTLAAGTPPFQLMAFANSGPTLAYALAQIGDDFTLSAPHASLRAGSSAPLAVQTAPTAGSNALTVTVKGSSPPPGISVSQATVTSGGTATLTLGAAPGTPSGSVNVAIVGAAPNFTRTTTAQVNVDGDDFAAQLPAQFTVTAGGTATLHITTSTTHGAPQLLTASLAAPPVGVTADPVSAQSGAAIDLPIHAGSNVAPGPLPLSVQIAGPVASQTLSLTATAQPHTGCTSARGALPWLGLAALAATRRRRRMNSQPRPAAL